MMNDSKFLESLQKYDKDNIKPEVIQKIRKYTTNPDFDPVLIEKASKAAKGLCMWCRAMETYDRVAKDVAPKRALLAQAEGEYAEVSELLAKKKAALTRIITDYNERYGTNHTINEFDLYYQDIQQRIKSQRFPDEDTKGPDGTPGSAKLDLVIVVDMLLTGFDSKYLNTLYVDKKLKHHEYLNM